MLCERFAGEGYSGGCSYGFCFGFYLVRWDGCAICCCKFLRVNFLSANGWFALAAARFATFLRSHYKLLPTK